MQRRKSALFIAFFLVLVLIAAGFQYYSTLKHHNLAKISLVVLPPDSDVTLNGQGVRGDTLYLQPGQYSLSVSRQDFGTNTKNITVQGKSPQTVYLIPIANTAAALQYLIEHPDVEAQIDAYGSKDTNQRQNALLAKYPFIQKLPAYNSDYRIDYSLDASNNISFSITLYAIINDPSQSTQYHAQLVRFKAEALKFLKNNGVDTSKYPIKYTPNV
ncbi:MAG TPA: hypothetical protein VG992_01995 [Candidatus Saccharimonadales bacterium]|nr:hypothetical protein [Candidatus Saccharimonadales bacterium]